MRVTLPGENQWADIREPDSLTGEDEVRVRSAVKITGNAQADRSEDGEDDAAGTYTGTAAATSLMEYTMLARVITSWSLSQPINVANIRALPLSVLRPLKKAIVAHMLELRAEADPNPAAGETTG